MKFVPNAPCGVESSVRAKASSWVRGSFLMHRVELKVYHALPTINKAL